MYQIRYLFYQPERLTEPIFDDCCDLGGVPLAGVNTLQAGQDGHQPGGHWLTSLCRGDRGHSDIILKYIKLFTPVLSTMSLQSTEPAVTLRPASSS